MDNKREAQIFINKALGINIEKESIEKYNSSFVSNELRNKESDIVYKMKNRDIFFLIEHQTKIDYKIPLRILEYNVEIMKSAIDYRKFGKKDYKLPLVIPIVLYTGKKKWNVQEYIQDIQEDIESTKKLEFAKYNLVDVNDYSVKELLEEKSFLTKAMLIEKAENDNELTDYSEKIAMIIKKDKETYGNQTKNIFILMINLILKRKIGNEKAEELIKILEGGNENMLAVLEMIDRENKKIYRRGKKDGKEEGREEGKKEGKIEGMRQKSIEIAKKLKKEQFSINQIMEITGLQKSEVEKI